MTRIDIIDGYMKMLNERPTYKEWVYCSYLLKREDLIFDQTPYNSKVLNYGCGNDPLPYLQKKNCNIVNVDEFDVNNSFADYHDLKDVPGHYDITVIKEVIEHMTPSQICDLFNRLSGLSDRVILTTPNVFDEASRYYFEHDMTHVRPYNTPDLAGVLKSAGYSYVTAYVCDWIKSPRRNLFARIYCTLPFASLVVFGKNSKVL